MYLLRNNKYHAKMNMHMSIYIRQHLIKRTFSGNSARGFSITYNFIKHTVFYKNIHQQNTNLKNIFNSSTTHPGVLHCYFYININSEYARRKLVKFSTTYFILFDIFIFLLPYSPSLSFCDYLTFAYFYIVIYIFYAIQK